MGIPKKAGPPPKRRPHGGARTEGENRPSVLPDWFIRNYFDEFTEITREPEFSEIIIKGWAGIKSRYLNRFRIKM